MSTLLDRLPPDFLAHLLAGLGVNLQIAVIALLAGLALGMPLAMARLAGGFAGLLALPIIATMRAAPTFVVMFFLLNAIPRDATLFGLELNPSPLMAVALSLVPYSAAYVADAAADALRHWRAGTARGALLFLPNTARAFFVLVMSSGAGAAIGVTEGIAVILREAERHPALGDRLLLFAIGIVCFGITLQAGFALVGLLQRRLQRLAAARSK